MIKKLFLFALSVFVVLGLSFSKTKAADIVGPIYVDDGTRLYDVYNYKFSYVASGNLDSFGTDYGRNYSYREIFDMLADEFLSHYTYDIQMFEGFGLTNYQIIVTKNVVSQYEIDYIFECINGNDEDFVLLYYKCYPEWDLFMVDFGASDYVVGSIKFHNNEPLNDIYRFDTLFYNYILVFPSYLLVDENAYMHGYLDALGLNDYQGAYDSGYSRGYESGYRNTFNVQTKQIDDAREEGYNEGYNEGFSAANVNPIFWTFQSFFNSTIFGGNGYNITIGMLFLFTLSLVIVAVIIRKML